MKFRLLELYISLLFSWFFYKLISYFLFILSIFAQNRNFRSALINILNLEELLLVLVFRILLLHFSILKDHYFCLSLLTTFLTISFIVCSLISNLPDPEIDTRLPGIGVVSQLMIGPVKP